MFLPAHIKVVRFCSEEIQRQEDDVVTVWPLVEAWSLAYCDYLSAKTKIPEITEVMIIEWQRLAMRHMTIHGYRKIPLTKSDGVRIGAPVSEIPRLMAQLINAQHDLLPAEFFREFEEIHPFLDGNGRTGKIIYNFLLGTLDDPQQPPDYWRHT